MAAKQWQMMVAGLVLLAGAGLVSAAALDELPLERWAKLREAERYQLKIAEKLYRDEQWKPALVEYEKYLTLYGQGTGAAFAQLKWANCQVRMKKLNTAIKDGYQSVIDYWPESDEAAASALLIARTYRAMGDLKPAKKAFAACAEKYADHTVAVLALNDLLDIATDEKDTARRLELGKQLTYDTPRKGEAGRACAAAANNLARLQLSLGDFSEAVKALATTYKPEDLPRHLCHGNHGRLMETLAELSASKDATEQQRATRIADAAVAWFKSQSPATVSDDATRARAKELWAYAGAVEQSARRPEKERELYEQMLKSLGGDDVLTLLAGWCKRNDRRDEARKFYGQFENKPEGQHQIAYSYREERKYDQAAEIYQRLSLSDDKNKARWMGEWAYALREAGKVEPAVAVYRDLLTVDADRAGEYHWQIALTYYYAQQWAKAIAAFRGTDRYPENQFLMAHAHRELKQFGEAQGLYRQIAVAHPPAAPRAILELARCQEQAGDSKSAIQAFKMVCARFPKSGEASNAHAHLQSKYMISVTLGGSTQD